MLENGLNVSVGSILNCKPSFITYASEKEMVLCLCKICLNTKFLFDPLMVKAKKDGDDKHMNQYHLFSWQTASVKNLPMDVTNGTAPEGLVKHVKIANLLN